MDTNGTPQDDAPAAIHALVGGSWRPSGFAWKFGKGQLAGKPVVFLTLETVIGRIMLTLSREDAAEFAKQLLNTSTGIVVAGSSAMPGPN